MNGSKSTGDADRIQRRVSDCVGSSPPSPAKAAAAVTPGPTPSLTDLLTLEQVEAKLRQQTEALQASSNLLTMFLNRCNRWGGGGALWVKCGGASRAAMERMT